jgi:hypothetical protein
MRRDFPLRTNGAYTERPPETAIPALALATILSKIISTCPRLFSYSVGRTEQVERSRRTPWRSKLPKQRVG